MLTKLKSEGAVSTAGHRVKKGDKGRVEVFVERAGTPEGATEESFQLQFKDFGNYGRERWAATLPLCLNDLYEMRACLNDLIAGRTDSTAETASEPQEESEPERTVAESAEDSSEVPMDGPLDSIDQLSV